MNKTYYAWEYEEQTKMKHKVLIGYLDKYFSILGKNNKLNYIDGFCGAGLYIDQSKQIHPGSPILAILDYEQIHKPKGTNIKFLFIDTNEKNLDNIKKYLEDKKVKTIPDYIVGDFDQIINKILDNIPNLAPTFILIDPFGCKGVKIETIKKIMQRDKTEIVLNFMFTRINEFLSAPNFKSVMKDYFGDCDLDLVAKLKGFEREKAIISLYRNQLKNYCGIKYVYPFPLEFPNQKRTYYYLFHLTNHYLGCSIMKSVFAALNYNRLVYSGNRSLQSSLFEYSAIKNDEIEDFLTKKFNNRSLSYIDLIKSEIDEIPYTESELKKCLKIMEKNKLLLVKRVTSKTARGLQEDDLLFFLKK